MRNQMSPTLREFQIPFELKTCDNMKLTDDANSDKTLKELHLYPAVTINLHIDDSISS